MRGPYTLADHIGDLVAIITNHMRRGHTDSNAPEKLAKVSEMRVAPLSLQKLVANQYDLDIVRFRP
jgi:hypothetical protein